MSDFDFWGDWRGVGGIAFEAGGVLGSQIVFCEGLTLNLGKAATWECSSG